jgi:hypothetical protein
MEKLACYKKSRSTMPQEEACQHHASSLESKAEMITPLAILNLKFQTQNTKIIHQNCHITRTPNLRNQRR